MSFIKSMVLIFIIGVMIVSCGKTDENNTINRIVYGLTLEPSGIDPHINQSSELGIVLRSVYDTLIYRDPETREFVPGLAESWMISEDGLLYTFNLRQDVSFHDDTPFNAQAVATNLDRILDPDSASQRSRFMLGSFAGYTIVDDYTIQLALTEPFAPLLDSLSQVYLAIASPSALAEYSRNRYQFHQVGTGPFEFVEYIPGDQIVIRRSSEYTWAPSFYDAITENSVEEIVFRFYRDEATRLLALESGDVDIMGELPPTDARNLSGTTQIRLIPAIVPGQPLQFLFNTEVFPTDNLAVRQALLIGTNRGAITDTVFQGFSPMAWAPLSESTLFYTSQLINTYEYDAQQAREILSAQGFVDSDSNGYFDWEQGDLEVNMIVPPWGNVPQVAQLIQDQWREIGIRLVLQQVPNFNLLQDAIQSGEYNLVSFDTPGLDPAFLNDYFITDGIRNWTGYSSGELDSLLQQAVQATDEAQRRGLYLQVQLIIMNEALILPIREYLNLNATNERVENLDFDTYGWFPILNNVRITSSDD